MSETLTLSLTNRQQAWQSIKTHVYPYLANALQADRKLSMVIKPETRSLEQNRLMWAALTDISRQVDWYGQKLDPEDWKHVLTASLKKQRTVPGLEGGFVVLGQSTSKMTIGEMSELLELALAFGAQKGVVFHELP